MSDDNSNDHEWFDTDGESLSDESTMISFQGEEDSITPSVVLDREPDEESALIDAAKWGYLEDVRQLLSERPELISVRDSAGWGLLHWASYNNHLKVVREVLNGDGANIELEEYHGRRSRPLHLACCWGCLDVVRELIAWRADVNAVDAHGDTPLHYACRGGQVDVVNELIRSNANLLLRNYADQWSPLHVAVCCGNEAFANERASLRHNRVHASPGGCLKIIQALVRNKADGNADRHGDTALHLCCRGGHLEILRVLLSGANAASHATAYNRYRETPLLLATSHRDPNFVRELLMQESIILALT